ncbi:bifunctional metallophosphatase/5'-nucleotidase [Veronia nyctiphanis]|uniref:Bifunctional metallophosphatase/5'-nucleotidase n=1 Tax=Veronia nyctiphanis TaxID=1278244 RepID=A0A4Q0YUN0_9GAMM|nr:bifunctional metallophosphatase/5'-nucleotidase [Veronia nyctiphanis]RXJ74505.1 bifunctional metallophosphatase/5'-nucleotidase [Veronia nyctiphanis]
MPISSTFKLSLAHINDTHSHFEPTSVSLVIPEVNIKVCLDTGGFARIKNTVDSFRKQADESDCPFLFLHAGDCFQGSLYYSLFKGEVNARLLNLLGLDAMTLGNHELDLGNTPVAEFLDHIDFPLLAGNWDISNEDIGKSNRLTDKEKLQPYSPNEKRANIIYKDFGNTRVAIFGICIDKMAAIANPDDDTPFLDATTVVRNTVAYLHSKAIKHIILLSHLGYEADLEMANAIEGLSVVIGGHSHTLQGDFSAFGWESEEPYGRIVSDTVVFQAGCHAMFSGLVELEFDDTGKVINHTGGNYLMIDTDFHESMSIECEGRAENITDAKRIAKQYLEKQNRIILVNSSNEISEILNNEYRPAVLEMTSDIVTQVPSRLRHVRIPDEDGGSCIAPLVCDAMLYSARSRGNTIDFAIHNAGGVRVSVESGPLTAAEVAGRLLPFEIDIVKYKATGSQFREALEGAINNATNNGVEGTGDGSYPYLADLKFDYDTCLPMGKRITTLLFRQNNRWTPILGEIWYTAVSSAYTTKGKEGYDALNHRQNDSMSIGVTLSESFIEYARTKFELVNVADSECHLYHRQ